MPETMSISDGTATAAGSDTLRVPQVAAPTYASLTHRAALLRDRAEEVRDDATTLHREAQTRLVDERTALVALQDPGELLAALAERGLSWTSIARMVGVTDAAIRKWRRGETVGPENRRRLARAAAFLEILGGFPVGDVGTWLEMRLSEDSTLTPLDFFVEGRTDLLFDFVSRRASAYQVLDAFDAGWRSGLAGDQHFSVVGAPDGELAIIEE